MVPKPPTNTQHRAQTPQQHPPRGKGGDSYKTLTASIARNGLYFLINTIISLQSFFFALLWLSRTQEAAAKTFLGKAAALGEFCRAGRVLPTEGGMGKHSQDAALKG